MDKILKAHCDFLTRRICLFLHREIDEETLADSIQREDAAAALDERQEKFEKVKEQLEELFQESFLILNFNPEATRISFIGDRCHNECSFLCQDYCHLFKESVNGHRCLSCLEITNEVEK